MTQNNNFSVLPFYDKLERQHKNKPYAFGAIYPLITPANRLLPFQFEIPSEAANVLSGVTFNFSDPATLDPAYDIPAEDTYKPIEDEFFIDPSTYLTAPECSLINDTGTGIYLYVPDGAYIEIAHGSEIGILGVSIEFNEDNIVKYYAGFIDEKRIYFPDGAKINKVNLIRINYEQSSFYIYSIDNKSVRSSITEYLQNAGLTIVHKYDKYFMLFPAINDLLRAFKPGPYYLQIQLGTHFFYSETFSVVENVDPYLKIEWWDNLDLLADSGKIIYEGLDYRNAIYLDTDIGKPDYKFEEDGKERDGYFFAEKQLSEKVYKFVFIAPEFVCDAIRLIRLSDNIEITKNDIKYTPDSFLAEVKWQEQGDLAAVDVEFRTNTVVKKIAAAWPK